MFQDPGTGLLPENGGRRQPQGFHFLDQVPVLPKLRHNNINHSAAGIFRADICGLRWLLIDSGGPGRIIRVRPNQ